MNIIIYTVCEKNDLKTCRNFRCRTRGFGNSPRMKDIKTRSADGVRGKNWIVCLIICSRYIIYESPKYYNVILDSESF